MRRTYATLLLTVCGSMLLANMANAEPYKVKKGECVSIIAQKFEVSQRSIISRNDLKPPAYIIYKDQILEIPGKDLSGVKKVEKIAKSGEKRLAKAVADAKEFLYFHPDGDPVGKGTNPMPYIEHMDIPDVPKFNFKSFAREFKPMQVGVITREGNPSAPADKKVFTRLNAMGFGKKGMLKHGVKPMFDDIRPAWFWFMDYEGKRYYLVCDQSCYNWAYYVEDAPAPAPKPPAEPEKPVAEAPPAEIPMAPPVEAPPMEQPPEEIPSEEVPPEKSAVKHEWSPEVKSFLYAGHYVGIQGPNSEDVGNYYGATLTFFPDRWQIGDSIFRIGPSYQYTGWDGETGNVTYDGWHSLLGAEAEYFNDRRKTEVKVLWGNKRGTVDGKGFGYHAGEGSDLLAVEGAHIWRPEGKNVQDEVGMRLEFASNNTKTSNFDGRPIPRAEDPPNDQSVYTVRGKRTWLVHPDFQPTYEQNFGWKEFSESCYTQFRPGVKLWKEIIEPNVWYQWESGSGNDTIGIGVTVNLSKLVFDELGPRVKSFISGPQTAQAAEVEPVQAVPAVDENAASPDVQTIDEIDQDFESTGTQPVIQSPQWSPYAPENGR